MFLNIFILIVILLIIHILLTKKESGLIIHHIDDKNNSIDSITNTYINTNRNKKDDNSDDICSCGCKLDECNCGKMDKNKLIKLLDNISSADKVILKNITNKWIMTKDIIDEKLKEDITKIIKKVLISINEVSNYSFFVNTIENMYVMQDDKDNFRCILQCFIFEVKKHYTIKLLMDIVSYEGEIYFNFIDIDESSISTIINNYNTRLSNYDMFDENISDILDNYYNDKYDIVFLDNKEINIDKSATITLNQLSNFYYPSNTPINKSSRYFCSKNKSTWNYKGINHKGNESCISNNNSYEDFPNIPNNHPNIINNSPYDNLYQWLFSTSIWKP